jgi:hypothetical protein
MMDFPMVFAVLLYLNVYYFGFYGAFEFLLLLFKATQMPESKYEMKTLVNEVAILAFMVAVETGRLCLGQQHEKVSGARVNLEEIYRFSPLLIMPI